MSYKNPTAKEIIANSTCYRIMVPHFHKSYRNLAGSFFRKKYGRKATLDDSEELFRLYALEWYDYYIIKPKMDKLWYKKITPIYKKLVYTKRDVLYAAARFIETKYGSFVETPDRHSYWNKPLWNKRGYVSKNAGDILKEMNIKSSLRLIVKKNHTEEFIKWTIKNKKHLPYHTKDYRDYSHLAYSGVTDDF